MPEITPLSTWGGTANGWPAMTLPAVALWVHHSVTTAVSDPWLSWRQIDAIGVSRGHGGISYSYVIHPDGAIGEGQGTRRGAHTGGSGCGSSPWGWNPCSFGICFVGNYEVDEVTEASVESFRWLRAHLIAEGLLLPDAPVDGHRHAPGNATACPGANLVASLDALRVPYAHYDPLQEDDVLLVGRSQAKPDTVYALHPVNGIIAAEFTCRVGEEVYGLPPAAIPYANAEGSGRGELPIRAVLPHVIDWLRDIQGKVLSGPAPSPAPSPGGLTVEQIRQVVRDELDKTRLAH